MAALQFDLEGEHIFETGVDHMALYVTNDDGEYQSGVAWNGITNVTESPSGAESNKQYADNLEYLNMYSKEEYGATIEAFTYPPEFSECDGSRFIIPGFKITQQPRRMFGFCYRTKIGNDLVDDNLGYKLHIVYSAKASPSEKQHATQNETPEAGTFSWTVTTTAKAYTINGVEYKPTSYLELDSRDFVDPTTKEQTDNWKTLLATLYGSDDTTDPKEPTLPSPSEIYDILTYTPGP